MLHEKSTQQYCKAQIEMLSLVETLYASVYVLIKTAELWTLVSGPAWGLLALTSLTIPVIK